MAQSEALRVEILARHRKCYVCEDFDLDGAGFQQYSPWQVEFDAWAPQPLGHDDVENLRPIHARAGAPGPLDTGWARGPWRNCRKGKSTYWTGREWCERLRELKRPAPRRSPFDDFDIDDVLDAWFGGSGLIL